jgi:type II secretory pathway component GspD/PulD (secretin)
MKNTPKWGRALFSLKSAQLAFAAALSFSVCLPVASLAQTPDAPSEDGGLTETRSVKVIAPAVSVPTPAQSTPVQPAVIPQSAAAAPPPARTVDPKRARKAEKLYLQGAKALDQKDSRAAYEAFSGALAIDPANPQYVAAREIALGHLVTQLVQEAEKARLADNPALSRQKLEEAYRLDPKNPIIAQHVEDLADTAKMDVEQVDEQGVEAEGAIELTPANVKKSFHLKGTQQEILRQVLSAYQITPVMDSSVGTQKTRIDADDVDYAQASQMAKLLSNTFFVPLDPKRVLVAKDTKENRTKFERLMVESVYLPGLTSTELTDISNIAKNVFDAPVATLQPTKNILTVRAPENRIKAMNATLEELLDGRSQVMIEVRLFDITTVRTTNIGVTLPSQITFFNVDSELNSLIQGNQAAINQIISSGLAAPGDYGAILAILIATGQITSGVLTQGFLTVGGGLTQFGYNLGTATANFSLNSSDNRALDEIHLRVQDQETATFKVGERYPIVTSTYSSGGSSLNAAGINSAGLSSSLSALGLSASSLTAQVTIPQIQYQDLGLTLKATPRVQHGEGIALNMELELTALGGSTIDGNPILNNRKYTGTITLKDGSSALIVSNLSKQETRAVIGLPGLDELPGLRSATDDSRNVNVSNLAVLVTPHIVRKSHIDVAGREIVLPRHD